MSTTQPKLEHDPRPLPEAPSLRRVIGPGVILIAGALGSGELILWPSLTVTYGLGLLWLAVLAVGTQYFLNMEIARYVLATGEGVTRGLGRMGAPWLGVVILFTIVPYMWPGWALGAATVITFAFGGGSVPVIATCALLAIALSLSLSPVVYVTLERIQMVLVGVMVCFIVIAVVAAVNSDAWIEGAKGIASVGGIPDGIAFTLILSAVGAAGAGGAVTLAYGNWLRDKGQGMGYYAPKIVSPFTGEEKAVNAPGAPFDTEDAGNMERWRAWWKVTSREQFITFFLLGCMGITVMCVIAYDFVFGQPAVEGLGFINQVADALTGAVGRWFALVFLIVVASRLLSTNVTIIDVMGRVTADAATAIGERRGRSWAESKIYVAVVWLVTLVAIAILQLGFDQPLKLLILGTALTGSATFIFAAGILWLNRTRLPKAIRLRGFRLAVMVWTVVLYGTLSAVVVYQQIQSWFG